MSLSAKWIICLYHGYLLKNKNNTALYIILEPVFGGVVPTQVCSAEYRFCLTPAVCWTSCLPGSHPHTVSTAFFFFFFRQNGNISTYIFRSWTRYEDIMMLSQLLLPRTVLSIEHYNIVADVNRCHRREAFFLLEIKKSCSATFQTHFFSLPLFNILTRDLKYRPWPCLSLVTCWIYFANPWSLEHF